MSRKVTLIEDIPVEKPHNAVQEFIENVLQKQLDMPSTSIRCALPKSDEEVKLASVPSSTTKYCCKVWSEWAYNRNKFCIATDSLAPEDPATVDIDNLAYWLERFVLEIRTKEGNEYNPNSLHHLRKERNITMMSTICSAAGIGGYKTNYSLRATSATRLYHQGIDEQLIMERTGHHSIEGVRSYKRTDEKQEENISNLLQEQHQTQVANHHQIIGSLPQLQLQNCTGITINIKY